MNQAARDKVTRARASLILDQPFFGQLALKLIPEERHDIPTFCTDGHKLGYNPDFAAKISINQVKSEVCHEVMHCVLDHVARVGNRDFDDWNRACDFAINLPMKDLGFEMDDTWLVEERFRDMSADHIYSIIHAENKGGGGGGGGQGGGKKPNPHIQPNPQAPMTPKDQRQWKIATQQAANAAKAMGKLPGSLEKFIDNILDSKVDWKTAMRQFVVQAAESDYSWMKPNRMMLGGHGIYLPGLWSEKMKPLAVFKDISGSIDDVIQDAFNAEVRALAQDCEPETLHVMYVDTAVAQYDVFTPEDPVKLVNIRGGGTSFIPPFEKLAEKNIVPACAIYLTDMQGSFPDTAPDFPVLWVSIDKNAEQPPFGTMIHIDIT